MAKNAGNDKGVHFTSSDLLNSSNANLINSSSQLFESIDQVDKVYEFTPEEPNKNEDFNIDSDGFGAKLCREVQTISDKYGEIKIYMNDEYGNLIALDNEIRSSKELDTKTSIQQIRKETR
ncbi:uncharacterized protein LOC112906311 [Agrilus planipennis]|uniref:Uncharacterized protein LOC112906311 n=1 Tax=Agrilus planipennis TaxID=224129 RepID=A0A7F5RJ32_AGRPL|nr:uncharacterized protein LOC112906311 [Agrilus planipennis]